MFLAGKETLLQQLCAFEIRGLCFYEIAVICTEPPGAGWKATRVGGEMIYAGAQSGDHIVADKIANAVSQVQEL